jgi:glucose 1-dehydrogenase
VIDLSLEGQRAVVTGASSGIGAATAKMLAGAGASVVITYRSSQDMAEAVVDEAQKSGTIVQAVRADISDPVDCARLFERTDDLLGGVDILIANAGVQKDAPFAEMPLEARRQVIDVNLTGQFLCAQEAVRRFREQGVGKASAAAGKIVFTSSVHQAIPWAGHANYAAAKGGLKLLMQSMAQKLSAEKIRVNAVAPGAIKTDLNQDAWQDEEAEQQLLKLIPSQVVHELVAQLGSAPICAAVSDAVREALCHDKPVAS